MEAKSPFELMRSSGEWFRDVIKRLDRRHLFIYGCDLLVFVVCIYALSNPHQIPRDITFVVVGALVICVVFAEILLIVESAQEGKQKARELEHVKLLNQDKERIQLEQIARVERDRALAAERVQEQKARELQLEIALAEARNRPLESGPSLAETYGEFTEDIAAIRSDFQIALKVEHKVFCDIMRFDVSQFRDSVRCWSRHEFVARGAKYFETLIALYESAKFSVVATTRPEYLLNWNRAGDGLLAAHNRSSARVDRIFMFGDWADVTPAHMATMQRVFEATQKRNANKFALWVWIESEGGGLEFPAFLGRDFTIIDDGEAIGVTENFDANYMAARWHFNNANYTKMCLLIVERLKSNARPFINFQDDWNKQKVVA